MNDAKWHNAQDQKPEPGMLVLVKRISHENAALGTFANGQWLVQPYRESWYYTEFGVTHWTFLPNFPLNKLDLVVQNMSMAFQHFLDTVIDFLDLLQKQNATNQR